LTAADDASGDSCGNGFQYNVVATVSAPSGTAVSLVGTSGPTVTTLKTAIVDATGKATFTNVLLPTGSTVLALKFDALASACPLTSAITVDCLKPAVTIVSPAADTASFSDVSKHLLASSATQAFKDSSSASAGAQTTVVACTNRIGSAVLSVGPAGGTLVVTGSTVTSVAAVPADNCPAGSTFVARFVDVTLPESTVNPDGTLSKATELQVAVTDAANTTSTGKSALRDIWVDSVAPTITENTPTPLCGGAQAGPGAFTSNVSFNSSTSFIVLAVTNGGTTTTYRAPAYNGAVATFTNVVFPPGANTLVVTATDGAGNSTVLTPTASTAPCAYTVGDVPVVTFVSPAPNAKLCAAGNTSGCLVDSDPGTPGWQGPITVAVKVGGAAVTTGDSVTFSIGGGPAQIYALDAAGQATIPGATIPDGAAVVVTATTANIAGRGTAAVTSAFLVDTVPPAAPATLLATAIDRRQTTFSLDWKAPADGTAGSVAGYNITVSAYNETTSTCDPTVIRTVPYTGTPKAPGGSENVTIPNLFIESHYCFTVVAKDAAGNLGPAATKDGVARFNTTVLTGSGTEGFGIVADGTADFGAPGANGFANDRLSDLLVGTNAGQNAYLFFGRTGGYRSTADVVFTGPAGKNFGQGIVAAGDIDGDGLTDIAINQTGASAADVPVVYIFSRKNAAWAVNGGWPASVDYTQANYTITANSSYGLTYFGQVMTRAGNFDNAGADDLAISASIFNPATGALAGRVIIVKGSSTFASITLPDTTNTIIIDGEAGGDRLGRGMQALADGTLIVAAAFAPGGTGGGKLYAFRSAGLAASNVASVSTAYDVTGYSTLNTAYGINLATLGPLGVSTGVVAASATGLPGKFVDVYIVPPSGGIFGGPKGSAANPTVHFISSINTSALGLVNIGSQVSGSSIAGSLIGGDAVPDLVIAGQGDPKRTVFVVSGAALTTMSGTVDLAMTPAPAVIAIRNGATPDTLRVPSDWQTFGRQSSIVLDLNGDGYSDFALTEYAYLLPGRTLVFW
jgi:hypothetical protein